MSIRRIAVQQIGHELKLPIADLDNLNQALGRARINGVTKIVLNPYADEQMVFEPSRGECHMESVMDYQVSKVATSWGCVCSECGGFHEFTDGKGWRFCPSCGAEVMGE